MSDLLESNQLEDFAIYSEKHHLFDSFTDAVSKLVIAKPVDPFGFLIDYFTKSTTKSIIVLIPPCISLDSTIETLAKELDLIHIQTSSLLAKAYEKQSSAGVQAHLYVEQGELVPDALITTMVLQRIKEPDAIEKGFILEGFPRTKDQAASLLQAGLIPDHVVFIDIPDEEIKKENEPLKLDTVTNRVYNVRTDLSVQNNIIESRLVPKYTPEVLSRKLDIFRRNHRELMELFPSQNARFYLPDGITGQEHDLLEKIHRFLGTCPISASPRGFRIIVSGLPGSGKSTIADYIAEKYGAVAVSPKSAMLQAISAGKGERCLPFINQPTLAPEEMVRELIVERLLQNDCKQNGWVLDGFPIVAKDIEYLQENKIIPNRLIWLNTPYHTCRERRYMRRFDPRSAAVVNLKNLPPSKNETDFKSWILAPFDQLDVLDKEFQLYENTHRVLQKMYGLRVDSNPTGIMHHINFDGIGEPYGMKEHPFRKKVEEIVDGHLKRPVPFTLK